MTHAIQHDLDGSRAADPGEAGQLDETRRTQVDAHRSRKTRKRGCGQVGDDQPGDLQHTKRTCHESQQPATGCRQGDTTLERMRASTACAAEIRRGRSSPSTSTSLARTSLMLHAASHSG